jgi:hypothetical protein
MFSNVATIVDPPAAIGNLAPGIADAQRRRERNEAASGNTKIASLRSR